MDSLLHTKCHFFQGQTYICETEVAQMLRWLYFRHSEPLCGLPSLLQSLSFKKSILPPGFSIRGRGKTRGCIAFLGKPCGVEQRTEGILPVVGVPPGCGGAQKRVEGGQLVIGAGKGMCKERGCISHTWVHAIQHENYCCCCCCC